MENPYSRFDAFGFRNFPHHLVKAGKIETLQKILLDIFWLQLKLEFTDVASLIADYDLLLSNLGKEVAPYRTIRKALSLSTQVLNNDKSQLRSQLQGRLCDQPEPEIINFLDRFSKINKPWIKPLTRCLISPQSDLVKTIEINNGPVHCVSTTTDGKYIIAPSKAGVTVWDFETGLLRQEFNLPRTLCAIGYGTNKIIAGVSNIDEPGKVVILDILSGRELVRLEGHSDTLFSLAVTKDGMKCISGDWHGNVKIWNLVDYKELFSFKANEWVRSIFITESQLSAVITGDKNILIFDITSGRKERELIGHTDSTLSVSVSPDEKYAISGSNDHEVKIWDFQSGKELASFKNTHGGRVTNVLITYDGKVGISQSDDWSTVFWDLETLQPIYRLSGHGGNIYSACLSPDGDYLLCGYEGGLITIWDLKNILSHPHNYSSEYRSGQTTATSGLLLSPDHKKLLSGDSDRAEIRMWNLEAKKTEEVITINPTAKLGRMAFFPDALHLAVEIKVSNAQQNFIEVWNTLTWQKLLSIQGGDLLTVMPSNRHIMTTTGLWDVQQNMMVNHWSFRILAWSFDKRYFALHQNNILGIFDIFQNKVMLQLNASSNAIPQVMFSPDNQSFLLQHTSQEKSALQKVSITAQKLEWTTSLPHKINGGIHFTHDCAYILFPYRYKVETEKSEQSEWVDQIVCLDYSNGTEKKLLIDNNHYDLKLVLPGPKVIVKDTSSRALKLVDLWTGNEIVTFSPDTEIQEPVILGPDNSTIIAGEFGRIGELFFLKVENL